MFCLAVFKKFKRSFFDHVVKVVILAPCIASILKKTQKKYSS